jgi:hypothetical protein
MNSANLPIAKKKNPNLPLIATSNPSRPDQSPAMQLGNGKLRTRQHNSRRKPKFAQRQVSPRRTKAKGSLPLLRTQTPRRATRQHTRGVGDGPGRGPGGADGQDLSSRHVTTISAVRCGGGVVIYLAVWPRSSLPFFSNL